MSTLISFVVAFIVGTILSVKEDYSTFESSVVFFLVLISVQTMLNGQDLKDIRKRK